MFAAITASAAAAAATWGWRRARLAARPESWPSDLTFARQLSLTKAFLKQNGWRLLEPIPPMYVRAHKNGVALALVMHTEETLSLPTLLKDGTATSAPTGIILGILSQQTLDPEFQKDAARNGIYVINPADLRHITTHIRRAAIRKRQIMEAGLGEPAPSKAAPSAQQVSLMVK